MQIHGVKYMIGAIIRVIPPTPPDPDECPFVYAQIKEVFIYKENKVFLTDVMKISSVDEHLRAIEVVKTHETRLCHSIHLYCHGVVHLKCIGNIAYIVERDYRAKHLFHH